MVQKVQDLDQSESLVPSPVHFTVFSEKKPISPVGCAPLTHLSSSKRSDQGSFMASSPKKSASPDRSPAHSSTYSRPEVVAPMAKLNSLFMESCDWVIRTTLTYLLQFCNVTPPLSYLLQFCSVTPPLSYLLQFCNVTPPLSYLLQFCNITPPLRNLNPKDKS
uniref:Uncharacterized protein n=1 Tax=Xenopus tropicalis TaxID=8364 RepID=A0A1B8XW50_XENTR